MASETEIREIEAKMSAMLVSDEPITPEFEQLYADLQQQLTAAKAKRPVRRTTPNGPTTSRIGHSTAAADYVSLHGLQSERLDNGGFKSFGEFLSVLGSGLHDNRIVAMRAAAGSSQFASGGTLVPESYAAEFLHPPVEAELIMPLARKFSMPAGTLHVSSLDNLSNEDGETFGGFIGEWTAEHEPFTERTPATSKVQLTRNKLGLFTVASSELVSDSQYEQMLIPALQQAISDFRDHAFLRGTGTGQPRGILNHAALIVVDKEINQGADTIVLENLNRMYSRIHPSLVRRCRWYCNPTCIPQLLSLVRETGTSGVPVPVLNETSGSFSMFGLPVELTSKLPVLGGSGDVLLADVSQYAIGFGRGLAIDRSEHARFQNDQIAWRVTWRGDGQGLWRAPFTPRNGLSLSWCVVLEDR